MNWIKVDNPPKTVLPVLAYCECWCCVAYSMEVVYYEDGEWYLEGQGEKPKYIPKYYMELPEIPKEI